MIELTLCRAENLQRREFDAKLPLPDSPSFIPDSFEPKIHRAASKKMPLGIVMPAKMLAKVIP